MLQTGFCRDTLIVCSCAWEQKVGHVLGRMDRRFGKAKDPTVKKLDRRIDESGEYTDTLYVGKRDEFLTM